MKAIETFYHGYHFRSRTEARWAVFFDALNVPYRYEMEGYDLDRVWYLPDFWLPQQKCWVEVKPEKPNDEEALKASLLSIYTKTPVYIFFGDIWVPDRQCKSAHKYDFSLKAAPDEQGIRRGVLPFRLDAPNYIIALFYNFVRHGIYFLRESDQHLYCLYSDKLEDKLSSKLISELGKHKEELIHLLSVKEGWTWTLLNAENFYYHDGYQNDYYWWCECPHCGQIGISRYGNSSKLLCGCIGKAERLNLAHSPSYQSSRLVAAYTAARQARF